MFVGFYILHPYFFLSYFLPFFILFLFRSILSLQLAKIYAYIVENHEFVENNARLYIPVYIIYVYMIYRGVKLCKQQIYLNITYRYSFLIKKNFFFFIQLIISNNFSCFLFPLVKISFYFNLTKKKKKCFLPSFLVSMFSLLIAQQLHALECPLSYTTRYSRRKKKKG